MLILLILGINCAGYLYSPYASAFIEYSVGKRGQNLRYSVSPTTFFRRQRKGKSIMFRFGNKKGNFTIDRNRRTNRPIGWPRHGNANQRFTVRRNKKRRHMMRLKTENKCLRAGITHPFFGGCNKANDGDWLYVPKKLGDKMKKRIQRGDL